MEKKRCLIIADDLTGGADTGVHFAGRGLKTLLVPFGRDIPLSIPQGPAPDVLVINTASRSLPPAEAFRIHVELMNRLAPEPLPLLYKKIDSTLRGNIGAEIEAILRQTDLPVCFLAPSYPEQGRTLEGGCLLVCGRPLALTETSRDTVSPVRESDLCRLLAGQTSLPVGKVALSVVAAGQQAIGERVRREMAGGCRILVFDAASRGDLAAIAEAAFSMDTLPLLAGSAGLAGEVARILAPARIGAEAGQQRKFRHILIVGGSASAVTHGQLDRIAAAGIPSCELPRSFVAGGPGETRDRKRLIGRLGERLAQGCVILRTFTERWAEAPEGAVPLPQRITGLMADTALAALQESRVDRDDLAMILVGGDTALAVLQSLEYGGIEVAGELLPGIVRGHVRGGPWEGLTIVTKAGAFGREEALLKILENLKERG